MINLTLYLFKIMWIILLWLTWRKGRDIRVIVTIGFIALISLEGW